MHIEEVTAQGIPADMAARIRAGELALDGDELQGHGRAAAEETVTFRLESLGGMMRGLVGEAVRSPLPILHVCAATNSLLIFNKCYGQDFSIPVRGTAGPPLEDGTPGPPLRESLHVFSAFLTRPRSAEDLAARFRGDKLVYMPTFGGTIVEDETRPDSLNVKPAIMDVRTRELMYRSQIGWRSLLYVSTGPEDPCPTGLVALEGFAKILETAPDGKKTVRDATPAEALPIYQRIIEDAGKTEDA